MEGVRQEKRLRPGYRSFVDLRAADLCRVDANAVRRAAEAYAWLGIAEPEGDLAA